MLINGKTIAQTIKEELKFEIETKFQTNRPELAVIQVGEDPASEIYVRNKKRACEASNIICHDFHEPDTITETELISLIHSLNENSAVNGILVQLPLPKHLDSQQIINAISPEKDVDCFTDVNLGKLFSGRPYLKPCTPAGIIKMLQISNIPLEGKNVTIIGRSNIVGKPLAVLFEQENSNVTLLHSHTKQDDLERFCKAADIIVVATGYPETLIERHLYGNTNVTLIDVGINRIDGKLVGDVSESIKNEMTKNYSPVPGGVGPMTIAMLLSNTLTAYKKQNNL